MAAAGSHSTVKVEVKGLMRSLVIAKPKGTALIGAVKSLADLHRDELGFHTHRPTRMPSSVES